MNDHFKKYFDRNLNKQHQHIPFMTHNRLIERFGKTIGLHVNIGSSLSRLGVKMHLPVSYLNPPDCRRVIVNRRSTNIDACVRPFVRSRAALSFQVTLSNADELFAYYVGEDTESNMHNVYLVKFGSM
jgi:hypothetical protein